jgi:dTDP-4-dehydrorhamnose reductase
VTRWLVTGAAGQLGTRAVDLLRTLDVEVTAPRRAELDITDADAVREAVSTVRPDVVLNAAAYTAVDAAEDDENTADAVNHRGAANLAAALAEARTGRLIHVSTDYVFAGDATEPYDVDAPVAPTGAYGRTKLAGERAVLSTLPDRTHVVRTAWVYGGPGPNFVDTMLRLERERDTVDVVADQIGSPTYALDLAAALLDLGRRDDVPAGVLHFANAGRASWFELAREVFRLAGADPARVRPTDTASFPRPAKRPAWSVLSTRAWEAAGLPAPRDWKVALAAALQSRTTAEEEGR